MALSTNARREGIARNSEGIARNSERIARNSERIARNSEGNRPKNYLAEVRFHILNLKNGRKL